MRSVGFVLLVLNAGALMVSVRHEASTVRRASLPSLYDEAERALENRGDEEAKMMKGASFELETTLLGDGDKSSAAVEVLEKCGVVRLGGVLRPRAVEELRGFVEAERGRAESDVESGHVPREARFADVLAKKNRDDLLLPLDEAPVAQAMRALVHGPVGDVVSRLLGEDAILRELSCLVADSGAPRQVVHPDTPYQRENVLLTCFVALQDVDRSMGPTLFLPNTHRAEAHEEFFDKTRKDKLLEQAETRLSTLGAGDASVFDSRTLHCGTQNNDPLGRSRYIFYVSFQNPNIQDPGNPPSIRPCYSNLLTLASIRDAFLPTLDQPVAKENSPSDAKRGKQRGREGEASAVPNLFRTLSRADPRKSPMTANARPSTTCRAKRKPKKRGFGK